MKKKHIATISLEEVADFISKHPRKNIGYLRFKGDTFRESLKDTFVSNMNEPNLEIGVMIDKKTTFYLPVKRIFWFKRLDVCDIVIKHRSRSEFNYIKDTFFWQRRLRKQLVIKDRLSSLYTLPIDKKERLIQ